MTVVNEYSGLEPDGRPIGNPALIPAEIGPVADGVHILGGLGNAFTVELGGEVLQVDTGPSTDAATEMIGRLRAITDAPMSYIGYSHGHLGYNNGMSQWLATANPAGVPRPAIVAQAGVLAYAQAVQEFEGLAHLNLWIEFGIPDSSPPLVVEPPTMTFTERMTIGGRDRLVELISAPSETADVMAVWVPDVKVMYGSAAVIPSLPNAGEPTVITPNIVAWADSLDLLASFEPEVLVRGFGPTVVGRDAAHDVLTTTSAGLRWADRTARDRINAGWSLWELLTADLDWPEDVFGRPWMQSAHGSRHLLLHAAWESYVGWWDRNPTHLTPASPDRVGAAVLSAIADRQHVLDRARELRDTGDIQLAMHVVDLLALAPPGDDPTDATLVEARALKAQLCRDRLSMVVDCFPVQQAFRASAEALTGAVTFHTGIR